MPLNVMRNRAKAALGTVYTFEQRIVEMRLQVETAAEIDAFLSTVLDRAFKGEL